VKASKAIHQLQKIVAKFGDLDIVGGFLQDETPLANIMVVNKEGMEIFPNDPNGVGQANVEGVFLTS
jgi:hypothetical protein